MLQHAKVCNKVQNYRFLGGFLLNHVETITLTRAPFATKNTTRIKFAIPVNYINKAVNTIPIKKTMKKERKRRNEIY